MLRLLTGPPELLTPLLEGLDAAELMAMPEPDAACKVVYGPSSEAVVEEAEPAAAADQALRTELDGLKLKALKARARSLGVGEEELADADDADNVKEAVMQLALAAAAMH